ncbi:MAG: glycosyltransferase family 9 protein [Candidatus Schekmanbacteria bacterium]|nr:glycosyltransferase family 9 protein [Candidatus Schekmanbacteria bacterium]
MNSRPKILILKLGYSETLDPEIGRVASLGDVVRTTPILEALRERHPGAHISWVVSASAEPLLHGHRRIDRILVWDEFVPFQLMREKFDVLVNLEKIPGVCAVADMIDAWTKYGFRFDSLTGNYHAYERGLNFIDYIAQKRANGKAKACWQKVLIEMMGVSWREQPYEIGYRPATDASVDIGLNHMIGPKWPSKAMPRPRWEQLEHRLRGAGFTTSWQQGLEDLYQYMDWINSCRILVSQDSLGVHIALALGKAVVAMFGPTDAEEIFFYGRGRAILAGRECDLAPCYAPRCPSGRQCMRDVDIDEVVTSVHELARQ